jgi:5-methylcytosine-specific restriction endonuclease McrA
MKGNGNKRRDGIRTLADLQSRCRRDDETGCLVYPGSKRGSCLRLPDFGCSASVTKAMSLLCVGCVMPLGEAFIATCGNVMCCNDKHRRIGTKAELMRLLQPSIPPDLRAKITAGSRRRSNSKLDATRAAQIRLSDGTCTDVARQFGVSPSLVSDIRNGRVWRQESAAASVFSWGGR